MLDYLFLYPVLNFRRPEQSNHQSKHFHDDKRSSLFFGVDVFRTGCRGTTTYFPPLQGNEWEMLDPASLNWCEERVENLFDYLESQQTKSFLILKDGRIVLEKYFGTYTQDSVWVWYSAGKSLRAVLVGIAQEEGLLDIADRTSDYLGEGWSGLSQAQENSVTIWHQLTMTSGLNELFFTCVQPACLLYRADAGTRWAYHNGPYNLLRNVLEQATGKDINTYTLNKVRNAIGMKTGFWVSAGDNTFFFSRARDMARFGLMVAEGGKWGNDTIIRDTAYFRQMVNTSQDLNPSYGYLWWLNGKSSYVPPGMPVSIPGSVAPAAPADAITAAGAQGQFISISRSKGAGACPAGVGCRRQSGGYLANRRNLEKGGRTGLWCYRRQ